MTIVTRARPSGSARTLMIVFARTLRYLDARTHFDKDRLLTLSPNADISEIERHLALLLGLAPDDEVQQPRLLFFAARRFIECAGLAQPTVFLFEDIHWAQASELELLDYLAQHVRESAVLLVAAARPELLDSHPTWGRGLVAQTTMLLEPLQPEESTELAEQILRSAGPDSADVARMTTAKRPTTGDRGWKKPLAGAGAAG